MVKVPSLRAAAGVDNLITPEPGLADAWQLCLYSLSAQHVKAYCFSAGITVDFTLNVFWGKRFYSATSKSQRLSTLLPNGCETWTSYRAKCPWQVRILLGCQQVKKLVAALKIAYCTFPIILVSKTNEGMKNNNKKKWVGEGKSFVVFGWFSDFSDQPEVYKRAWRRP